MNCIFCKIIKGEAPCTKLYEDEKTFAFLDISPVNPGHTLVIPKEHYQDILEAPEEVLEALIRTTKKLSAAILKGTNSDGLNIAISNRKAAGQAVFHLHVHIIPRLKNDGLKLFPSKKYSNGEAGGIQKAIKKELF